MTKWRYLTCRQSEQWTFITVNSAEEMSAIVESINTWYKSEKAKLNKNGLIEVKDVGLVSVFDILGQRGWELVIRDFFSSDHWNADFKRPLEE